MASLAPGTRLGRYCIIKEINRGGTAVVYEGVEQASRQAVALKVIHARDGTLTPARREVQFAASGLRHPSIVQLLDYFEEGGYMVLVWELVQGLDLLDFLNSQGGVLTEAAAATYFVQLVHAVQFIHSHGMAHRDLKPENCMVEAGSGAVRLIDFGLSRRQESACTLGVGTPDYMAPELLGGGGDLKVLRERHTGSYDAISVDAWSCGVLLYLLVTGRYPFEDPDHPQNVLCTLRNISAGRYRPIPPRVSPACVDLIGRMLTVDPAARIRLPEILQHPWLSAAGAVPADAAAAAAVGGCGGSAPCAGGCTGAEPMAVVSAAAEAAAGGGPELLAAALASGSPAGGWQGQEEGGQPLAPNDIDMDLDGTPPAVHWQQQQQQLWWQEQQQQQQPCAKDTFSFHHQQHQQQLQHKSTPATPRVINLTAAAGAGSSANMSPVALAVSTPSPPSPALLPPATTTPPSTPPAPIIASRSPAAGGASPAASPAGIVTGAASPAAAGQGRLGLLCGFFGIGGNRCSTSSSE